MPLLHLDPVQVLKACDCYDYQSCETDDYPQSEAKRMIETIKTWAITTLPSYDKAEWAL